MVESLFTFDGNYQYFDALPLLILPHHVSKTNWIVNTVHVQYMYNSVNIGRIILSKLALTLCRTTGIFYRFNIRYKLGQPREIILENEHLFLAVLEMILFLSIQKF